jgi:TRAP-type C4-dicarboxylate transport system permease small subunit
MAARGEEPCVIERSIRRLALILAALGAAALLLMLVQTVADVAMANLAGRPIPGNLEIISLYHMVALVFLPLAFVEQRHEHVSVDLVVRLLPRGVQRAILVASYLVCAGFFGLLTYQTLLDAIASWRIGEITMGAIYVTIWPAKFALPAGFAAILLMVLLHAWKAATDPGFNPVPADPAAADEPA